MPNANVDVVRLGMVVRRKRQEKELTLKEVADATGLKIPTLSRIERGASGDVEGGTLLVLSRWLGADPDEFIVRDEPVQFPVKRTKVEHTTPEIVEIFLRADKNLDSRTASALATMFRTAYETVSKTVKAK